MEEFELSERVRHALAVGIEAAKARHHDFIGPEHQLLGLLADRDGVAAAVLDAFDIDRAAVVAQLNAIIGMGDTTASTPDVLPHTTRARHVLELAVAAAREMEHSYVGTEHLLIALVREQYSVAAQLLAHAGVTEAGVRAETLRLLGPPHP